MEKQLDDMDEAEIKEAIRYLQEKMKNSVGDKTAQEAFGPNPFIGFSGLGVFDTLHLATKKIIDNPTNVTRKTFGFLSEIQNIVMQKSEMAPEKKDRRFSDPSWEENLFYSSWLKSYFGWKKQMKAWVDDENFNTADRQRVKFIIELFTDALSPSNSILNPAAVKRFFETGGTSYANGTKNFIKDLITNSGMPSQVDKTKFELGKNVATTPGKIVYCCEELELIQYKPQTKKVRGRPVFIIPPQINKYYILDLSENKSVVKYLVDQGLQIFMVSWRNPTPKERNWSLETYIEALDKAIDAALDITGNKSLDTMAACTGGITALTLLAYYSALNINKISSLTMLVSLFDMGSDTPLSMFADEKTIEMARERSQKKGVLKGKEMGRIFSWMRPNDLIWNYWVNNYLMGNKPPAFDILFWNSDTTQLPAAFHSEVLDLLKKNILVKPGGIVIKGQPIDLGMVNKDVFSVAGTMDHICPWKGCYKSLRHVGKKKNVFVLSQSGHMQCLLNLPGSPKGGYYKNSTDHRSADQWLKNSEEINSSWWEYWVEWISERSGDMISAPKKLGSKNYPPIMDAPGLYVRE